MVTVCLTEVDTTAHEEDQRVEERDRNHNTVHSGDLALLLLLTEVRSIGNEHASH